MFSVIVPTRDRGPQLSECLRALADQDLPAGQFEVIVVDDGSGSPVRAPSWWPAGGPALRVHRIRPAGPAAARNAGADLARFPHLVFTDDDCRPARGWLSAYAAAVAGSSGALLGGRTRNGVPDNRYASFNQALLDSLGEVTAGTGAHFLPSNNFCLPAEAFREVGGFDTSFPSAAAEDREFCERWRRNGGSFGFAAEAVVEHHHPQGLGQFVAMHRRYGAGARRLTDKRGGESAPIARRALAGALHSRIGWRGLPLLALSQLAAAAGYYRRPLAAFAGYCSCAVFYLLAAAAAYVWLGAAQAELGGSDEAAHVVSGIMTHQYLHTGLPRGEWPLAFAERYHFHYPKVAIGHWPPLFYLAQAVWLSLTGISRIPFLLFSALQTALLGLVCVWLCRKEGLAWPVAVSAGLVAVLAPGTLHVTLPVMSDAFVALTILLAAVACGAWLKDPRAERGAAFAVACAGAFLTKGNAFALALVPPLAAVASGRGGLVTRLRFWLPLALAAALALPWYWYTWEYAAGEIVPVPGGTWLGRLAYVTRANSMGLLHLAGIPIAALALCSWGRLWRRWPALLSVPPALFLFLSLCSPHSEQRLMIASTPLICFAAAYTLRGLAARYGCIVLVALLAAAHWQSPVSPKPMEGFPAAVAWARGHPAFLAEPVLISSNRWGEGAWISELALHSPLPSIPNRRASKILESTDWMSTHRRLLAPDADSLRGILHKNGIRRAVFHRDPRFPAHPHQPVLETILRDWRLEARFGNIALYSEP